MEGQSLGCQVRSHLIALCIRSPEDHCASQCRYPHPMPPARHLAALRCTLLPSVSEAMRLTPDSRHSRASSAPSAAHLASASAAACLACPTDPPKRSCFDPSARTVAAHTPSPPARTCKLDMWSCTAPALAGQRQPRSSGCPSPAQCKMKPGPGNPVR